MTITSVCAHASLLDPSSPSRYTTSELMRAVKLAALMDVEHVEYCTLEIGGDDNVIKSYEYLKSLGAE